MLNSRNTLGKIIYVDDQFASRESMRLYFEKLEMGDRLSVFVNGQDVIDYFNILLA